MIVSGSATFAPGAGLGRKIAACVARGVAATEVGATAPLLLYPDGSVQHAGAAIGLHDYGPSIRGGLNPDGRPRLAVRRGNPQAVAKHDESRCRGAHIDPGDLVRSERRYGEFRTLGDPFYSPSLTLRSTGCELRLRPEALTVSVPEGPMAGRFSRVRLQHIWRTAKKGPTEIGYAYFRARRRRRNVADDRATAERVGSARDLGRVRRRRGLIAQNAALVDAYRHRESFEIRSVLWFLPYFHHVYFGGVHTLLRFADHFARKHGVENRFHCYDVGAHAVGGMARKVGRGVSLAGRQRVHLGVEARA